MYFSFTQRRRLGRFLKDFGDSGSTAMLTTVFSCGG
ncbi:hypothetical protein EC930056_1313, partial [Escherichia coli 93.0056]